MPITLVHPAVQRVLDVAARKGVTLEVMTFPDSTHTAADAARVVGAEIAQLVSEHAFDALDAPVVRVAARDVPIAASQPLEAATIPGSAELVRAARQLCRK